MPRVSLEAFRLWWARRGRQRIERVAARLLAGISPHIRADIGVPGRNREESPCLRLWTGGVT
jgi:hypothetical protein